MLPLVQKALDAHGGLKRWRDAKELHLDLEVSGAIWALKGQPDLFSRCSATLSTHEQKVVMHLADAQKYQAEYTPSKTTLHGSSGDVVQRDRPRDHFDGHFIATPWDRLDAIYFCSYALWTYFNSPFLFEHPGLTVRSIEPWKEGQETWDRLHLTYPDTVTTHTKHAVAYIDKDGMVRRYDYAVDIMMGSAGANYARDYASYDGILLPRHRQVYGFDMSGNPQEPLLVDIKLIAASLS